MTVWSALSSDKGYNLGIQLGTFRRQLLGTLPAVGDLTELCFVVAVMYYLVC